ncbi:MAG: hypothetical protein QOD71_1181 [Thermoleophilaceae bacterium]|jgi:hypothetical protein|nr:hypothetical protein [Thermoleophilaceae bacterium]
MLNPSRNVVVALAGYVVAAFIATVAIGDLGDVGFWIVWIPLLSIVVYLAVVGVRLASTAWLGRS